MPENTNKKENTARKNILRESSEITGESVKGYDFNSGINWEKLVDSFSSTGFQATNLSKAIEIIKKMRQEKAFIYLGYTSNLVTSGLRDIFRYLAEHKLIDVIVTTAGGVEEDFIKCLGDFKVGKFDADGKELRDKGINRAGNIFIPNSRYCRFEEFIIPILERYKDKILTPSELIKILGKEINNKESIYYWCYKNNIPVFCPAVTDGSLGDMIYFFKNKNPNFKIDVTEDIVAINNSTMGKKKTGIIILGSGIIKHHICNANMFRNGADYAVYINSQQEFDGSDTGALPEEAVSWGKIAKTAESIKVYGDATILFPIIAGKAFV
ncbi:deoxyhypusine synthase [Candidatus Pacearchaeota archaeon]|nr:deoxyhypusine synthase [Candidatus Pacearchaeota archaeon]